MDDRVQPLDRESATDLQPGNHKAELRLWLRLLTCSTLIENGVRKRLRDSFDVTLPRFDLMAQLDKARNGMTLGELSRRMMVSNGNITAIVDALVAQGLLQRQSALHDKRAQIVSLTDLGRSTFGTMAAAHEDWIAEAFGDLTTGELDQLMALLARTKHSAAGAFAAGEK
jgi:DNA-binding MarR family transcriptional regulator